ncbi:28S ribosomal protein S21, mitochondrial [Leptopilina boulardi]|uniref:28S ribosomal protein S21, mitochondrial n=1 Tax=Leptopilina boulardi TaxID=63433 RepID=UPI0021F6434F|nr:28S ribosomal protein S21, mitochondrial [Leptopilina boulardi]
MGWRHSAFLARTVLIQNKDVDSACRVLNRVLGREGIFDQYRRTRYYEKPFLVRRRINYQTCKAIYDEDMSRKIKFVMRTNRITPHPGCM